MAKSFEESVQANDGMPPADLEIENRKSMTVRMNPRSTNPSDELLAFGLASCSIAAHRFSNWKWSSSVCVFCLLPVHR